MQSTDTYSKQVRTVLGIELLILIAIVSVAVIFWTSVCGEDWGSCVGKTESAPVWFLILSVVRPFVMTPTFLMAIIGGEAFGPYLGALLASLGNTLSCLLLYLPAKYFGKIYVKPFLSTNLPAMWRLIRTQDYKVILLARCLPIFHFDLFSIVFGVLDFRFKSIVLMTFLGSLPEALMFARIAGDPSSPKLSATAGSLTLYVLVAFAILLLYEIIIRRHGSSLWKQLVGVYRELLFELRANNEIMKRHEFSGEKPPVILLYGFFSSRRSLAVMERILSSRGYEVMSFNLGGMFGVFFTRGIKETARFIDIKIRRQISRHNFKSIKLVAHSKGGLVALWWLLKLGGSDYCRQLICMATPFTGSRLTYLALVTPLGLFWRDVWQMRPGSEFLAELHALDVPKDLKIYCIHSENDGVATGERGMFHSANDHGNIHSVPMNHLGHFEFLYRRDVGDMLAKLLRESEEDEEASEKNAAPPP